MGRPALALLSSGDSLIAWTRYQKGHGELVVAHVHRNSETATPSIITASGTQSLGYPRMQVLKSGVLLSWGRAGETKEISTAVVTLR